MYEDRVLCLLLGNGEAYILLSNWQVSKFIKVVKIRDDDAAILKDTYVFFNVCYHCNIGQYNIKK